MAVHYIAAGIALSRAILTQTKVVNRWQLTPKAESKPARIRTQPKNAGENRQSPRQAQQKAQQIPAMARYPRRWR